MKPLVIFEMANNHMGEVAHGQAVIEAFARAVDTYRDDFDFGFKLQYRDLDSFVHPAAKGRADIKYVKRFEEETNLRALLVLDTSASMHYAGSAAMTKLSYGATLAAAFALLLLRQRDAVGLALFDADLHALVPPRSVQGHLRPVIAALEAALVAEARPVPTAAAAALAGLADRLSRRSLVVVLSDLYETERPGGADALLQSLRRLRHRGHEVLVFRLLDAATERGLDLPSDRPVTLIDRETNERVTLTPMHARAAFTAAANAAADHLRRGCLDHGIAYHDLDVAGSPVDALVAFLNARRRSG